MKIRCFEFAPNRKMIARLHVTDEQIAIAAAENPELVQRADVYQLAFRMAQQIGRVVGEEASKFDIAVERLRGMPLTDYCDFLAIGEAAREVNVTLVFPLQPEQAPVTPDEFSEFERLLDAAKYDTFYKTLRIPAPPPAPPEFREIEATWNEGWTECFRYPDEDISAPSAPDTFADNAKFWTKGWERGFDYGLGIGYRAAETLLNSQK